MTTLLGRSIVRECLPQPQPNNEIDHGPSEADPRVDAPRTLTEGDVAALIINKMIGTGIFTGPYAVLLNTQNKTVAMVMWAFGFLYTILR